MALNLEMTKNQISQIAKMLYLNLDEIQNYVKNNQEEIQKEEQEDTQDNIDNEQKQCNSAIWQQYTDDTICKVNIDKNYMKGEQL